MSFIIFFLLMAVNVQLKNSSLMGRCKISVKNDNISLYYNGHRFDSDFCFTCMFLSGTIKNW